MTLEERHADSKATVLVSGKISGTDIVDLCKMIESYRDSEFATVVVDLSKVNFIDSHGLGGLVYSHILLEKVEKKLIIAGPQGHTKALFRDCALEKVLTIVESVES